MELQHLVLRNIANRITIESILLDRGVLESVALHTAEYLGLGAQRFRDVAVRGLANFRALLSTVLFSLFGCYYNYCTRCCCCCHHHYYYSNFVTY